ncbi:acid protease [Lentinus tigrinus ALCF2SS1-6]|uniref:Acid protease n=1 Tax=Lentinus tigrinus ALCF2SS1-6 TaxID=1328759 RepID=A0A5C2S034_9APHY|nr:acid protease [Lentinus tigrinus ALCF2SS1-6]
MLAKLRLLSLIVIALTLPLSIKASVVRKDATLISLPVAKRVNMTGTAKLLEIDQARARALRDRAEGKYDPSSKATVPATNVVVTYVTTIGVGQPPQEYHGNKRSITVSLLIDTGSSNTWIGASLANPYRPADSKAAHDTGNKVFVAYGSGAFSGIVIENQSIGDAFFSKGFDGYDGILGIGPTDLTCGTLIPATSECIPTVTDNAFAQGLISNKEVGIAYAPTTSLSDPNGELTFGGINEKRFSGPLRFVSITYGKDTPILNSTAGIVDTGTTLVLLATDALNVYKAATNATSDPTTGLLKIAPDQYSNLQSLFFHIGDETYEFTANAQIWPRALNTAIGGEPDAVYLIVNDLGALGGSGLDFINGMTFLERFYHVYDSENNKAGFATTDHTYDTTN